MPRDDNPRARADVDPHANPDVWAPRLTRVLDRQVDLYTQLDALSQQQSELVRTDQSDALLDLLARRQTLVQQLTDLNQQLEPFTRQWTTLVERLSSDHRKAIGQRTERLDDLIAAITERDEADRKTLESRRAAVAGEINTLTNQRAAVSAYRGAGRSSPRFQDREG